jgi:hypothetical protein
MAMITIPSMATEAPPLFAGQFGPLRRVEFTGLGRPLYANAFPASYQVLGAGAASSPPATYTVQRTLQVATAAIGATVNRSA